MNTKQVIVIRKDLNMRKGKMVAQGAHASIAALCSKDELLVVKNMNGDIVRGDIILPFDMVEWFTGLQTKIVVGVDSLEELVRIYTDAKEMGLPCSLIKDAGLTEFNQPTFTAVAIGPTSDEVIDAITGKLKLL